VIFLGVLDDLLLGVTYSQELTEDQKNSDIERCRYSLTEFVKTYMNDGTGEPLDELCEFHYDISGRLEDIVLNRKQECTESCYLSPRGHGKSFWTSLAFPIWCVAYKHTKNILIVTNEATLGRQFIIDIRQYLEDNEKFREDFGDLTGDVIWTSEKLACSNGISISSKGSGASTRGVKIFNVRPTVIICDDILTEENSGNQDQRTKLYNWYTKVLCKCGSKYCSIFCIGTLLNDACLLAQMFTEEQFSDYHTKKYQAVMEFSESDLWNTWTEMRNKLENPSRTKDADQLYFENKEEMLKGTKVLWDRYEDTYLHLMKEKQKLGDDAWATEMMNDGLLEETREFKEDWLVRNYYEPEDLPKITDIYIGVDAAATAHRKSDDSAIVVIGRGVDNYLYVLDVYVKKVNIDELADHMVLLGARYYDKIRSIRIEDVVFQILVKNIMEKRAMESGLYLPFEGVKVAGLGKKEFKLRSLVIPVRNGYLKFRKDQRKLLDEMRRFPKAASDNAMDALWIATFGIIGGAIQSFSFTSLSAAPQRKQNPFRNIFR